MSVTARPTEGTDNARLLDAMLEAYPNAIWSPNSRLKLMAHSRAADLRKLGWSVESVRRSHAQTGRPEYGYVLKMQAASIADARRASTSRSTAVAFTTKQVSSADVAERCGLTLEQLRYLDRSGHVPYDVVGTIPYYFPDTVRLLQGVGLLAGHGIGLDTALTMLRHHAGDLAAAVRLATPELTEGAA